MKKYLVLPFLLILLSNCGYNIRSTLSKELIDFFVPIETYCQEKYPNEIELQEMCFKLQLEGALMLSDVIDELSPVKGADKVIAYCVSRHYMPRYGIPNYEFCYSCIHDIIQQSLQEQEI